MEGRAVRYSVELPDIIVLDEIQDEIFRRSFRSRIRIGGSPGTGKTTVLLKRLAQKTNREFLTEKEESGISEEQWDNGNSWVLFSPSDLLKVYVKEAMGKEGLPATDAHVKVFHTYRSQILREIGFIGDFFTARRRGEEFLKNETGTEQVKLAAAFGEALKVAFTGMFREALDKFKAASGGTVDGIREQGELVGRRIDEVKRSAVSESDRAARLSGLTALNSRVQWLVGRISKIEGARSTVTEEMSPFDLSRFQQTWLELLPSLSDEGNESGWRSVVAPNLAGYVAEVRAALEGLCEQVSFSEALKRIAKDYLIFRQLPEIRAMYFDDRLRELLAKKEITEQEQDVLLFHALQFGRSLYPILRTDTGGALGKVQRIFDCFRLLVAIDEATDFSPVQIACMEALATPELGGATISGDLMQRVTAQGLRNWNDLDLICEPHEECVLSVSYRQSERLFAIAKDLFTYATKFEPGFQSAYPSRLSDPPALGFQYSQIDPEEDWIGERILEICKLCDDRLPTVAVLVPSEGDVLPTRERLADVLEPQGFEVDAAGSGQNLGDSARVRVFPVANIKGLEFEAVFYSGVDRMADLHHDMLDKYVYVGLSRARNFLGVTYEGEFPERLRCIRHHFVEDRTWVDEVGE